MPFLGMLTGGKSSSLLRDYMDEPRSGEIANSGERIHQSIDVVSVYRSEIPEAELLE